MPAVLTSVVTKELHYNKPFFFFPILPCVWIRDLFPRYAPIHVLGHIKIGSPACKLDKEIFHLLRPGAFFSLSSTRSPEFSQTLPDYD